MLDDLAKALVFEAEQLARAGADALQIDEPVLYNIGVDKILKLLYRPAVENVEIPVKLHLHVASFEDFVQLLKTRNIQYVGVEAAKYPFLLDKLTQVLLEDHEKKLPCV